jgi:hypothetical protein
VEVCHILILLCDFWCTVGCMPAVGLPLQRRLLAVVILVSQLGQVNMLLLWLVSCSGHHLGPLVTWARGAGGG